MKQIFIILVLCVHSLAMAGRVYTVKNVPNPKLYNNTYVSDPDHLLKPETVERLNRELMVLEQVTSDQIAVVVLSSIGQSSSEAFATGLMDRFRIGQKDKDNGLLILLILDQKRLAFRTGYGLQEVLPVEICKRIESQYMLPLFKEKKYDEGLLVGLSAFVRVLSTPEKSGLSQSLKPLKHIAPEQKVERKTTWITAGFIATAYIVIMFILFFAKNMKDSFTEDYKKLSEARKRNISLTISKWRWLMLYVILPIAAYALLIYLYQGPYLLVFAAVVAYVLIAIILMDKKKRSVQAYASSFQPGDYYDQYNKFNRYFDNWGIAAVFFPVPFLFTDWGNGRKLKAIRLHDRHCIHCQTALVLLDEKKDDERLLKGQLVEESIKSIDYDVWFCPSCRSHYALGYNSKFSTYQPCTFCGTVASFLQSDVTKIPADSDSDGTGEKTYACMYCKKTSTVEYTIPRFKHSSFGNALG
jgi:uncharacterized protein